MKKFIVIIALFVSLPSFAYVTEEYEEHIEDVYESECGSDSDCVAEVIDRESE